MEIDSKIRADLHAPIPYNPQLTRVLVLPDPYIPAPQLLPTMRCLGLSGECTWHSWRDVRTEDLEGRALRVDTYKDERLHGQSDRDPAHNAIQRMSSTNSSWAPNEPAAALWAERSYLDGIFVGAVAYGVHATLFFITLKLLLGRPRTAWRDYSWIVYIVALFTISSIGNGSQLKFTQIIFIDARNYPGGPAVFYSEGSTDFMAVFCNSIYTVNTWLQDGLLLYRFWVIFGRSYAFVALPALVYTASVGLGCAVIFMLSRPGMTIWSQVGFQLVTAYWSVSIAFNILLTCAIVSRLLFVRRKIGGYLGSTLPYVSVSTMLIESAFLYSACGIAFLVAYGINSPVQNLLLPTLAQMQSIAPLLIIMRVAQGRAWTASTSASLPRSDAVIRKLGTDSERTATGQLAVHKSNSDFVAEKVQTV